MGPVGGQPQQLGGRAPHEVRETFLADRRCRLEMPKRSGTWTADEDRCLLDLKGQGKLVSVIAKEMGRTEMAVIGRLGWLKRQDRMTDRARPPSSS
jgi:hypothetical protein